MLSCRGAVSSAVAASACRSHVARPALAQAIYTPAVRTQRTALQQQQHAIARRAPVAPRRMVRAFSAQDSAAPTQSKWNNVTPGISNKIGRNLHLQPGHPLTLIKNRIAFYFAQRAKQEAAKAANQTPSSTATSAEQFEFTLMDNVSPIVTVEQNFDQLLFAKDHPGRSLSDTFYFDESKLLRTHTSAHQHQFLRSGLTNFLVAGDCYRRDEIDASHYPVFHQMEGVRVFTHDEARFDRSEAGVQLVVEDLKSTLEGLVRFLFGESTPIRWDTKATFPFTHPSLEMEIEFQGKWMEVLGCGVIQPDIMDACSPPLSAGRTNGWAFGLGLERLAMILFDIPDIRLFWSEDPRFLNQFSAVDADLATTGKISNVKFQPFSKYPACFKDVSFWLPPTVEGEAPFHENDLCSMVREVAGDLVEDVECIDSFVHPKTKQESKCYRIMYRSLSRTLTNEEVDLLQEQVREQMVDRFKVKLR